MVIFLGDIVSRHYLCRSVCDNSAGGEYSKAWEEKMPVTDTAVMTLVAFQQQVMGEFSYWQRKGARYQKVLNALEAYLGRIASGPSSRYLPLLFCGLQQPQSLADYRKYSGLIGQLCPSTRFGESCLIPTISTTRRPPGGCSPGPWGQRSREHWLFSHGRGALWSWPDQNGNTAPGGSGDGRMLY